MSLKNGRVYRAIPGPSVMPDTVLQAMHRAAPNIYDDDLFASTEQIASDLKYVARTDGHVAIYIGNGHAAWEAAIANSLTAGDQVLVLATGRFGFGWADMANKLGIKAEVMDFGQQSPAIPEQVTQRLRADSAGEIKAVLICHVDTATSVKSNIADLRTAIDAANHPALFMVDCIASLGCDEFLMDAWGVDVMVSACQKGLMTPPGMAFVYFNDRAAAVRQQLGEISAYWDWAPRVAPKLYYQFFCGTAPTHHLFGLQAALTMIKDEGIEQVWQRHAVITQAVWAAADVWGDGGPLALHIDTPQNRSHAVSACRIDAPNGTALREWCENEMGVTLGIGLGMAAPDDPAWHGFFRIGHMGHVNGQMIMGALGAIGAGLSALEIAHGDGALEAAARVLARG